MDLRDLYCKEVSLKIDFTYKMKRSYNSKRHNHNSETSVFNFPFLLNCLTDETGKPIYNQMVTFHHNLNFKRRT